MAISRIFRHHRCSGTPKRNWRPIHIPCDFYQNHDCEYFPCHQNTAPETFSCLFCYFPLYALGDICGGNFTYTSNGIKDCSACLRPHKREYCSQITEKLGDIIKMVQKEKL